MTIVGESVEYGRGGNGGSSSGQDDGSNAANNTGNGGGGGWGASGSGGNGGSGIVVIRYPTPAATYYSRRSGAWSERTTWSTSGCNGSAASSTPHPLATVIICSRNVTLDENATISGLQFADGGSASLTHQGSAGLIIGAGGVEIGSVTNGTGTKAWNINGGAALINGDLALDGGNNHNRMTRINISDDGRLDINGNLSIGSGAGNTEITASGQSAVFLSGHMDEAVRFEPGDASTFTYDGSGVQSIVITEHANYHNLVLAGSGIKNQSSGGAITGTTTVTSGVVFNNSESMTYQGNFINNGTINASESQTYRGDFSNTGTFNAGARAHHFAGTEPQQITGETTFGSLAVNNSAGLLLNSEIRVQQQLGLTAGVVTTGDNVLEVGEPGSAPIVSASGGWVAGNLALYVAGTSQSYHYPLGDAAAYRPLALENMNVATPGYLLGSVSQSAGDHPQIASSNLDASRSVNRWWSLHSEGAAVTSTFRIQLWYQPMDVDGGANPGRFEIQRYSGGAWQDVTVLGRDTGTAPSIQGRSTGFGDFAIAEPGVGQPGPLPEAMIEYRMDEDSWSGNTADVFDSSGNNNHGSARGGVTTTDSSPAVPGDPGSCRYGEFDGINDYIDVPGLSGILNATASLAFWIRTTQPGRSQAWEAPGISGVEVEGGTNDIFWGWIDDGGGIGISVGDNFDTKSSARINDGSWHHVVLSRNHIAGRYEIYIDGALNASGSIEAGVINTPPYSSIGRIEDTAPTPEHFAGSLDEVRVYDRMLTLQEVQALASATRPCGTQMCPTGIVQPGLIGSYYNGYDDNGPTGELVGVRVDGPIDFDWGTGSPGVPGVNADMFSVRWQGFVRVTQTGDYRFQTRSDDGIRLWLDNRRIINNWTPHSATNDTSSDQYLVAGRAYPIVMEYFEERVDAEVRLRWNTPSNNNNDFVAIPAGPTSTLGAGLYSCAITSINYYGITHSGSGLTCEAEPITITAYDAAHNPIAPPGGTEITLSTDPVGATWAGGNIAFFDGSTSAVTKFLRQTSAINNLNIDVSDGITTEHPQHDPAISFADTGLKFYGGRQGEPLRHQVAGVEDSALVLRAVQTDTDTGACVARLQNTDRPLGLAYECRNPSTCSGGQTLLMDGSAVQSNNDGGAIAYSQVLAHFDAEGFAALPFIFSDVGQLRLHAQLELPDEDEDEHAAITLPGSSQEFVVKPYTLAIGVDAANPGTTDSGDGFIAAGETFSAYIEGRNAQGQLTPAFGRENSPVRVQAHVDHLVWPTGGNEGALSNSLAFAPSSPGVQENSQLSWNQVGSIRLRPSLVNGDYLGAGDLDQTPQASGIVGRFYPYEYRFRSGEASHSCGTFTYMDQPAITINYSIEARGYNMGVVSNYDSGLDYGKANPQYVAENDNDGNPFESRIVDSEAAAWSGGILSMHSSQASFARANLPDGPYQNLRIGVQLDDSFDNRAMPNLNMNAGTSDDCTSVSNCDAAALNGELDLRFGRLRLSSAFGPESANLPTEMFSEHWDGSRWIHNSADSCTQIAATDIFYNQSDSLASKPLIPIGGGETEAIFHNYLAGQVRFVGGRALDYFKAPGAGNMGEFTMRVELDHYPWLTFDWNGNGVHDDGPIGQFNFGSYRGHDRVIYWREIFD